MAIGQCGSVLGSHIFPATEGPRYIKGFAVSCGLEFFGALCAIVLTVRSLIMHSFPDEVLTLSVQISYRVENARRDKKYGKVQNTDTTVDTRELADKVGLLTATASVTHVI